MGSTELHKSQQRPYLRPCLHPLISPFRPPGESVPSSPNQMMGGGAQHLGHHMTCPGSQNRSVIRGLGSCSGSCPVAAPGALFFLPLLSEHRRSDPSRDMWPSQYKQTALWGNVYQASSTAIPGHCSRVSGHPLSPPLP